MRLVLVAGLLMTSVPASALISAVAFHGYGHVAFVDVTGAALRPPRPGAAVMVTGTLDLGPAAVADGFTGNVVFDETALSTHAQSYNWTVDGGQAYGNSAHFVYAGGTAAFVAGRLTAVDLFNDYDSEIDVLMPTLWSAIFPHADSSWGGNWALSVPEPASWLSMVAGFTLCGTSLRRRRDRRLAQRLTG